MNLPSFKKVSGTIPAILDTFFHDFEVPKLSLTPFLTPFFAFQVVFSLRCPKRPHDENR